MTAVNTALVGGNMLFRQALCQLLDPDRFTIVAESRDFGGIATLFGQDGRRPKIVLADFSSPHDRDLEGLMQLRAAAGGDCRIVVLAGALELSDLVRAFRAGADGYLTNDLSVEALSLSLRLVLAGEKVLPGALAGILVMNLRAFGADTLVELQPDLSSRETEIMRCLVNGDSNKRIARALGITEGTVKVHLKSLMRKIAVSNRTQAALWARDNGLGPALDAGASVMPRAGQRSVPDQTAA